MKRDGQKKLISVIVPVCNVEKYIRRCVNSILVQTYQEIEIILIDDGSTDSSGNVCDEFARSDNRVRVFHQPNKGLVNARKRGVREATGKYVLNVDGDDWIEPERIQTLVQKGIETGSDMIYMAGMIKDYTTHKQVCAPAVEEGVFTGKKEIEKNIICALSDTDKCFCSRIRVNIWMWAVRRELLLEKQSEVDERISQGEDLVCVLMCLADAESVCVIHQGGYHYVQDRKDAITYREKDAADLEMELQLVWINLVQYISDTKIRQILSRIMIAEIMVTDYSLLLEDKDFLYPYSKVKKHSKIVIYGAGKLGFRMVSAIAAQQSFYISAWLDKEKAGTRIGQYTVMSADALYSVEFDYIVVAILDDGLAKEIAQSLAEMGICREKIALMDADIINEDNIPFIRKDAV